MLELLAHAVALQNVNDSQKHKQLVPILVVCDQPALGLAHVVARFVVALELWGKSAAVSVKKGGRGAAGRACS